MVYIPTRIRTALAALAQARGWRIGLLDALFWLWPALCPIVFAATGTLCTPIIVALALARTWRDAGLGWPSFALTQPVLPLTAAHSGRSSR